MDRSIAPVAKQINTIDYIFPEQWELSNGVKVYGINAGSQELVKIDMIFEAGTWYQPKNLVAGLTNSFMNQGTKHYSAQEIAESIDFRGAYIQLTADQQFGNVSLLSLNKHLPDVLKVVSDVVINPQFPKKEVNAQLGKKRQQFVIENNKVKTLAQKRFSQVVLGEDHPYSNSNKYEDYDKISIDDFKQFHKNCYSPNNCKIIVAGNYDDAIKNELEQYFGSGNWPLKQERLKPNFSLNPASQKKYHIRKADALQSAIRMGMLMPNRKDEDFHALNILSTVLGGYFGSRLMMNIREDKGYTYGIGAGIYTWPSASYLSISTEVGTDVTQSTISEIYKEVERLSNKEISDQELAMVKNFLLGEHLRSLDGVFAMSNSLRTLIEGDVWYDHFDEFIHVANLITPTDLKQLAQKYFKKEMFYEVVAGK